MSQSSHFLASDALLVVDVQNDFCLGGALAVPEGEQVVGPCNQLIDRFETVIFTQDWHPENHSSFASSNEGNEQFDGVDMPYGKQILWPDHCVQGTSGAEFHPDIMVQKASLILRKGWRVEVDSYSAFLENNHSTTTGLGGYLRQKGIDRVFLCGLAADYCVAFSARDGVEEGFDHIDVEAFLHPIPG